MSHRAVSDAMVLLILFALAAVLSVLVHIAVSGFSDIDDVLELSIPFIILIIAVLYVILKQRTTTTTKNRDNLEDMR